VEKVHKACTLRASSPKLDNQEGEIIIRSLSLSAHDPPTMNKPASADAHLTVTDTLKINESNHSMDSDIPGPGMGSNLGTIHDDNEVFDNNSNDRNLMCTDQVDWALN